MAPMGSLGYVMLLPSSGVTSNIRPLQLCPGKTTQNSDVSRLKAPSQHRQITDHLSFWVKIKVTIYIK